jgi:4-amino-4-deoxy-L-arabinose transferase-like glycosyltransferase
MPSSTTLRKLLIAYLFLLVPISWLAMKFDPYQMDGDGQAYIDIADLIRSHQWAGVISGYWNPLYPAGLALAQQIFHPSRARELAAYYVLNYVIFLLSVVAMLAFVDALVKLRTRMLPSADQDSNANPLLGLNALRLLGVGLLVIAAQRELSMGKIRPDALLQALMLAAFAMLLQSLACESLWFPPLMGLFLGLAYLSKSFAFLVAFLSIGVMMLFQAWLQRRRLGRVVLGGALAFVVFAAIAGPYIAALSKQKGRFDFGDSGALNYAWYVSGTDKMHIEPWMTNDFGSATVHLIHPEKQLLANPGIYSYRAVPYGEYPEWFDTTYFKERIVPKFNAGKLLHRDIRNLVLVFRYLFNHPEAWILLLVLLLCGARLRLKNWRHEGFWLPAMLLGLAMWFIYGLVNIEERYVTLAYLVVVLPVFAMLRPPARRGDINQWQPVAATLVTLFAFLALGETLRIAFDERRMLSSSVPAAWYSQPIYGAAIGLAEFGVKPGDEVACIGTTACLTDTYWMRLAGVRTLTEVYNPQDSHLMEQLESLPNRQQVFDIVKAQGAKVLVGYFDPGEVTGRTPASQGWVRLDGTDYYALPLNLPVPAASLAAPAIPWTGPMKVAP